MIKKQLSKNKNVKKVRKYSPTNYILELKHNFQGNPSDALEIKKIKRKIKYKEYYPKQKKIYIELQI